MSAEPVADTDVAVAKRVIVDSVGAMRGTLSHAVAATMRSSPAKTLRAIIAKSIMKPCS
jgi:DNA polymerase III delta prime subunit